MDVLSKIECEMKILARCKACIEQKEPYDLVAVKKEQKRSRKNIAALMLQMTPIKSFINSNTADLNKTIVNLELLYDGANKVHRKMILEKKNAKMLTKVERTMLELKEKLDLLRQNAKEELDHHCALAIRSVKKNELLSGLLRIRVTGLFGLPKDTPAKNGRWASEYFKQESKFTFLDKYRHMGRRKDDFIIVIHVGGSNVATVAWNEKKTMYGGDEKQINLRKCGQLEFEVYYTDNRSLCAFGVMPLDMLAGENAEESLALSSHKRVELFPEGVLHCQAIFTSAEDYKKNREEEDTCRRFNTISLRRNGTVISRSARFRHSCTSIPRNEIETLNCYEMKRLIGIGAFGSVQLAQRKKDRMYYAVKVMKRRPSNEKMNMNELTILKELNHPFICGLFSDFKDNGNIYIVMEFCEAGDLHTHLSYTSEGFEMDAVEYFAASIVLAVEYLHQNLYVHRDLKTENIMLTREGHLKIIDFGLCKKLKTREETMTEIVGTTTHLSAEIHRREPYGIDMDWYAVGVSLYQLRTRDQPYHDFYDFQMTKNDRVDKFHSFKDLLVQLMTHHREARLGFYDSNDVRKHPFFYYTKFYDIYTQKMKPPFVPYLQPGVDLRYFPDECCRLESHESSQSTSTSSNASTISHF